MRGDRTWLRTSSSWRAFDPMEVCQVVQSRASHGGEIRGFDLVAVWIEDEGGEVGRHRGLARARCSSADAAFRERDIEEGAHGVFGRRAQADVEAGVCRHADEVGPVIEPEFGIALAEADGRLAGDEPRQPKWREHAVIDVAAQLQVAHGHRDMIDHCATFLG